MGASVLILSLLLFYCSITFGQSSVEVPLWPGPGVKSDPRLLSIHEDGPCGPVAIARVKKLPNPNKKGALQSELVVELSESGAVIRRWPKPVDYDVVGAIGEKLLLSPYGKPKKGILVTSSGYLAVSTPPRNRPESTIVACPLIPDFGKSDYVRRHKIKEIGGNKIRLLAYEGPCT